MHDQLVPVRIAKLRHPADRRFHFVHVERDAAFLQLADRRVDVVNFESDCGSIPRRLPGRMTADSDGRRFRVRIRPRRLPSRWSPASARGFPDKTFRARSASLTAMATKATSLIMHSISDLWIMILFPSGSCTTAMRQTGTLNILRERTLHWPPSSPLSHLRSPRPQSRRWCHPVDGFHWSPTLPMASVSSPRSRIQSRPPSANSSARLETERAFVKSAGSFHVGHWNAGKGNAWLLSLFNWDLVFEIWDLRSPLWDLPPRLRRLSPPRRPDHRR